MQYSSKINKIYYVLILAIFAMGKSQRNDGLNILMMNNPEIIPPFKCYYYNKIVYSLNNL